MEHSRATCVLLLVLSLALCFGVTGKKIGSNGVGATRRKNPTHHPLTLDFYSKSCPQVDHLVYSVTSLQFKDTPVSGPATIRLFFHDCFVEGCDGSILIAPGQGGMVERDVAANKDLAPEAFETVDKAKAVVESKCPGVVSCADILAIAARDFVHLAGGPYYEVKKGRRDSKVSLPSKVTPNLPTSNTTTDDLLHLFARKGLDRKDLVALSGAHTIGFSHCPHILPRLYDFRSTGQPDPALDPRLLKALRMSCPRFGGNKDVVVPFDVDTPFVFDNKYYGNLAGKLGLLETDEGLVKDLRMRSAVETFAEDVAEFFKAFVVGMEKMGSIGVKRGRKGEVRKVCTKLIS